MAFISDEVEACPYCGSRCLVVDPVTREIICRQCGSVCGTTYLVLLDIPGAKRRREDHKLSKHVVPDLDRKYYILAAKVASVLGMSTFEVYKLFAHHYSYCREQKHVEITVCLVARSLADIAMRIGRPPVAFVREVMSKIWRKSRSFTTIATIIHDYLRAYLTRRRDILKARLAEALRKRGVPVDAQLVEEVVEEVYSPGKSIETLVREGVALYIKRLLSRPELVLSAVSQHE